MVVHRYALANTVLTPKRLQRSLSCSCRELPPARAAGAVECTGAGTIGRAEAIQDDTQPDAQKGISVIAAPIQNCIVFD